MELKNYHHDHLKSELIEKGLKILDKEGYEGFSLRKAAKACNVSHTAPYRHFRNKDELIMAIGNAVMHKFGQALQQAVDKYPNDPRNQLKEMGCAYIKFFTENPEYLRLIFLSDLKEKWKTSREDPANDQLAPKENDGHPFEILYQAVQRYKAEIKSSANSAMDQDALLLYCWGLVHGIAIIIARKEFPYQGDYLELIKKIIWNTNFLD